MKRATYVIGLLVIGAALVAGAVSNSVSLPAAFAQTPAASAKTASSALDDPGFYAGESGLNPSERAGREIWYKATAGNDRFYTYVFPQRLNVLIDWYRVLNAKEHDDRFAAWGIINDPGCCVPGAVGCPAKNPEETYGFEWCPGDEELLKHVGRPGYRDPACDYQEAPLNTTDPHQKTQDQRQSACDLAFGTSTGAIGFRKFPNPRFDKARWIEVNGSLASWEGYRHPLSEEPKAGDSEMSRLADGSIEPPFLIGVACASCHASFNPLNPPKDTANPKWENIRGIVGNQYSRISEVLSFGMPGNTKRAATPASAMR
ncbi:MAG: cytochrome c, partial [Nitrosospira sp.]|nr:cytochrome c [Nitrosospira sp.]